MIETPSAQDGQTLPVLFSPTFGDGDNILWHDHQDPQPTCVTCGCHAAVDWPCPTYALLPEPTDDEDEEATDG